MASEVQALVLSIDQAFEIRHLTEEILGCKVELHAFIDSKTIFYIIGKDSQTHERRIPIDICALQESYAKVELTTLGWIPEGRKPADALVKKHVSISTPLCTLITNNIIDLTPQGWASVTDKN